MATYVHKNNQQIGPLDDRQVVSALQQGIYSPEDLGWREGLPEWQTLRQLYPTAQLPPPLPGQSVPPPALRLEDNAAIRLILPVGRSGWAIAAGYLGLFGLIVLPAPLALLVSIIAIIDIQRSRAAEHPKRGMGRAIFGLVVGLIGTVILVAVLFSAHFG